jgi:hypothetical protein
MKRLLNITLFVSISLLLSCEKAVFNGDDDGGGNVTLNFSASNADPTRAAYDSGGRSTRATVSIGDYFEKLNVMLFDSHGEKVFDKVDTRALKDTVSVLKDLTALARDFYDIPTAAQREQREINRERLEIEKKRAEQGEASGNITIIVPKDAEGLDE